MKAKCINDKSEEYPNLRGKSSQNKVTGLTKDKLYEVEQSKQYDDYFEVLNDSGIKESYKKERFEVMENVLLQCLNKNCEFNKNEVCTGIETNLYKLNCVGRIKPQHTPSYAEEQLEHAKEKEEEALKAKRIKKVRCIHTFGLDHKLTLKKEYSALEEDEDYYYIEPDDGMKDGFQKHLFEEVEEQPINYEEEYKKLKDENERLKKEVEEGYECIENEYKNKLFLAEQEINRLNTENACLKAFKEKADKRIQHLINSIKNLSEIL